jgi:hypothetical protein
MAKAKLQPVAPTTVNRTVTPRPLPNSELRTREHLTPAEVEGLIEAVGKNRRVSATRSSYFWAIATACERPKSLTCAGSKSTSKPRPCTSAESRTARQARIR